MTFFTKILTLRPAPAGRILFLPTGGQRTMGIMMGLLQYIQKENELISYNNEVFFKKRQKHSNEIDNAVGLIHKLFTKLRDPP